MTVPTLTMDGDHVAQSITISTRKKIKRMARLEGQPCEREMDARSAFTIISWATFKKLLPAHQPKLQRRPATTSDFEGNQVTRADVCGVTTVHAGPLCRAVARGRPVSLLGLGGFEPLGIHSTGRDLKEGLEEQFCDRPIERCQDTRLHDAAYVGDLPTVQKLLQEDRFQSRINEKSVWSCGWLPCTPLRIAATAGHGHCVNFLIQKGADIDLVDVKGQTALYVAVVHGHLECVRILLEAGADPSGSRHHRSTPVYHAARVGRADILQELIKYGANVDVNPPVASATSRPSSRPLTSLVVCPLYISAAYHHLQCFKVLLEAGANPDFNGCGPVDIQNFPRGSAVCIMDAVLRHGCDQAFVILLIDFGANLNWVKWETLEEGAPGRMRVNSEGMQIFREARSCPRRRMSLCRVAVRRSLGKCRQHLIDALPVPEPIKKFLCHEPQ